jgi:hypothetical protein
VVVVEAGAGADRPVPALASDAGAECAVLVVPEAGAVANRPVPALASDVGTRSAVPMVS